VLADVPLPSGPHPNAVKPVTAATTNPTSTLRKGQFFVCFMMLPASGVTPAPSG
jgi:hypothetical protein